MSLDRFIFCPCQHALEAHGDGGCRSCACTSGQRVVIDRLLEIERDEIHRTWLGVRAVDAAPAAASSY